MKVKLLSIYAGATGCFSPGDIVELEDDKAAALIKGGYASAIKKIEIETAAISVPETSHNKLTLRKKGR